MVEVDGRCICADYDTGHNGTGTKSIAWGRGCTFFLVAYILHRFIHLLTYHIVIPATFRKVFTMKVSLVLLFLPLCQAFVPFIDGGKGIPKLYDGYFDEQIAKQAASAMSRAIAAGNVRSKVQPE